MKTAGRPIPGAMAAAAIAATAGILVGANLVSRDLSVAPPPDVPAVTLPAGSAAPAGDAVRIAGAQLAAAVPPTVSTPVASSSAPPPSPPIRAIPEPSVVTASVSPAGARCGEPPGWARDLAAKARLGHAWSGPCSSGEGKRNGWRRNGG